METVNSTQLAKSCTAITDDIEDNVKDAVDDSMRNIYGDLANSDESVKREFLKNSPFKETFKTLKEEI